VRAASNFGSSAHSARSEDMSRTRFGREAVGDPNVISQLKDGRELRAATVQRILDYLNDNESEECPCDRCSL
jgi:hypothetical protein